MASAQSVEKRTLAIELARAIVLEVAPDELPTFDANAERSIDAVQAHRDSADEMLGIGVGLEALLPVATSAAVGIAAYSVQKVMEHSTKALADRTLAAIGEWFGRLWRGKRSARERRITTAPLTREQLARVRDRARRAALSCGVAPAQAALLADSLVGLLAVA